MKKKISLFLPLISIVILCFAFYGNTMKNGYSLDDDLIFSKEFISDGFKAIPKCFTEKYVSNSEQEYSYRPIVIASFVVEISIFGKHSAVSHFINILLYAGIGMILWLVLLQLFKKYHWILPALVTFLFLVHPIHSEVVASLKNRDELLSFLFALSALLLFLKVFKTESLWYKYLFSILAVICFLLSTLSKISNVTFIVVIPITLYFFANVNWKKITASFVILVGALVFTRLLSRDFIVTNDSIIRNAKYFENPWYVEMPGMLDRIPMLFYSMGFYIKMLLIPYPLRYYYGYDQISMADWSFIWAWVAMIIILTGAFFAFRDFRKKKVWVYGFLFFCITIVPFTNFLSPAPGIVAERFAFSATLGFVIILSVFLLWLFKASFKTTILDWKSHNSDKNRVVFYALLIFLTIMSGIYIRDRNTHWKSSLSLFTNDYPKTKRSAKALSLLANEQYLEAVRMQKDISSKSIVSQDLLAKRSRYIDKSITHYKESIAIYPEYTSSLNNLGGAYLLQKGHFMTLLNLERQQPTNMDSTRITIFSNKINNARNLAKENLEKALVVDNLHAAASFNLGKLYASDRDVEKAITWYRRTLEKDQGYILAFEEIVSLYEQEISYMENLGINSQYRIKELLEICEQVAQNRAYTNYKKIWVVMGSCYRQTGDFEKEIDVLQKALVLLKQEIFNKELTLKYRNLIKEEYGLIRAEILQKMKLTNQSEKVLKDFESSFPDLNNLRKK